MTPISTWSELVASDLPVMPDQIDPFNNYAVLVSEADDTIRRGDVVQPVSHAYILPRDYDSLKKGRHVISCLSTATTYTTDGRVYPDFRGARPYIVAVEWIGCGYTTRKACVSLDRLKEVRVVESAPMPQWEVDLLAGR